MTKHDGYFHLLMTATLLGGFLFMSTAGESVWRSANKGVSPCFGLSVHMPRFTCLVMVLLLMTTCKLLSNLQPCTFDMARLTSESLL